MFKFPLIVYLFFLFGDAATKPDYYALTHGPSLIGLRPNGYVMIRRHELTQKMMWESIDKVVKPPRALKFDELHFEPLEKTWWGSGSKGTWFMHNEMWRRDTKHRFKSLAASQGLLWGVTENGVILVRDKAIFDSLADWSKMDGPPENVVEKETYGVALENPVAGRLVSLAGSKERIWGIDEVGQLWSLRGGDTWVQFPTQMPLKSVATDMKGLSLWLVGPQGRMWTTDVGDEGLGEIKEIGGDFERCFAGGNGVVVGVNYYNQAFMLDENNGFQMIGESLKTISVIPTGTAVLEKKPRVDPEAERKKAERKSRRKKGSKSGLREAVSMKASPKKSPKYHGKKKKPTTKMDL